MKKETHSKKAEKYGIDLSLIEANLKLSYTERIIRLQKAIDLFSTLKSAGEKHYAGLRKNPKTSYKK